MMKTINKIREITGQVSQKHVGAYAAQSAYFFVLSMIPIILLLLAIIQYTPVTKADVMTAVVNLFPETNMQDFMVGIVNEVYNQSKTVIPITAIVALWSAGKGVLAVSTGLNCAYELRETRNYVFLRIRASIYTILFIAAIVMALVLSVFGNNISIFIYHKIPFLAETTDMICCYDWNFASGISLFAEPEASVPGFDSGIYFLFSGMAGDLVCFFNVSDNLQRIFRSVRKYDGDHSCDAVAVFLYVCDAAGRAY